MARAAGNAATRRASLSLRLTTALARLFLGIGSWRDTDIPQFVGTAVPLVQGSQRALAALVSAQQAVDATAALGRPLAPPRIPDVAAVNLRPIAPNLVYARPFATVHAALARGLPLDVAVQRGATRAAQIAEADLQLTYAHASRAAVTGLKALYWRRTLVGTENCAMCVLASTVHYTREDLNPIHPACDCSVTAVYKRSNDPLTEAAESALIERAHVAARELTGASDRGGRKVDYRKVRTRITAEHGELGTMLVNPSHHFTDEDEALSA